ncbi:hypothetical protein B0I31_105233 [Saccharothrix carnea]|uniref:Uncharacterized protein n=1 Tax=Saccharothrix carnea TaxID=1280637 RepID=A0A2P8I9Y1_SACCR|nr:hypothetical protein [Saccharothrix carnea]PSL55274.1 hypothetical protein B0I31_105233 [Saccharothrix carnea]
MTDTVEQSTGDTATTGPVDLRGVPPRHGRLRPVLDAIASQPFDWDVCVLCRTT